jgi:hypothetical protein
MPDKEEKRLLAAPACKTSRKMAISARVPHGEVTETSRFPHQRDSWRGSKPMFERHRQAVSRIRDQDLSVDPTLQLMERGRMPRSLCRHLNAASIRVNCM